MPTTGGASVLLLLLSSYACANSVAVTRYNRNLNGKKYALPDIGHYSHLVVEEARDDVLVTTENMILNFTKNLDAGTPLRPVTWTVNDDDQTACVSRHLLEMELCTNYIRMVLPPSSTYNGPNSDKALVCGTFSYKPKCTWRSLNRLSEISSTVRAGTMMSPDPRDNITILWTQTGKVFLGTFTGPNERPTIARGFGSESDYIETRDTNPLMLKDPQFVSSYEFGNFIYFFFREVGLEYANCGKRILSRVGRVCATDQGSTLHNDPPRWTSFRKATLNCFIPGEDPFYFKELQDTFNSESKQLLYAIFSTERNAIAGSAICAFNRTALDQPFGGKFKHQKSMEHIWNSKEFSDLTRMACPTNQKLADIELVDEANHHPIMADAVQPTSQHPIFTKNLQRWTHLVVDHVRTKAGYTDVYFVATEDRKILKIMSLPISRSRTAVPTSACLLQVIEIPGEHPIQAMEQRQSPNSIYVVTYGHIFKIPKDGCEIFKTLSACVDPYCGWKRVGRRFVCIPAPGGNINARGWRQQLTGGCPEPKYTRLSFP